MRSKRPIMKRRKYLAAAGATISIAGCMRQGDPVATLHPQAGTGSGPTYAELETDSLITAGSLIGEVPWAYVIVSNNTDYDHSELELRVEFHDDADSTLQQQSPLIEIFPAGTSWITYLPMTTPSRSEVASVVATVERAETGTNINSPDQLRVQESRLTTDPGAGVTVAGTLLAANYSGRVRLIGLVYDSNDRFRGTVAMTSEKLDNTEEWEFETSNPLIRTPTDHPEPASCEFRIESVPR
jgi:hypothetical protein